MLNISSLFLSKEIFVQSGWQSSESECQLAVLHIHVLTYLVRCNCGVINQCCPRIIIEELFSVREVYAGRIAIGGEAVRDSGRRRDARYKSFRIHCVLSTVTLPHVAAVSDPKKSTVYDIRRTKKTSPVSTAYNFFLI